MPNITVDEKLCIHCGACAASCPVRVIAQSGDDLPKDVPGAEMFCVSCGHCVAVCPKAAVSQRTMSPADCLPYHPEALPSPDQADLLLRARRSIRAYKKEPLAREEIRELLDVARYAPTGLNRQPVQWTVAETPEEVRRLAGCVVDWMRWMLANQPQAAAAFNMKAMVAVWESGRDPILRGAPHLVVAHAPKDEMVALSSATIALTFLDLAAWARGFGACWAGYFHIAASQWPPLLEALGLPEGHAVQGAMMLGRPEYAYRRIPARKPLAVTWR